MQIMREYAIFGAGSAGQRMPRGRRVAVHQWELALLFRHGLLETTLGPGAHRRWRAGFTLRAVDMRPWVLVVPTQEVPTADGVTVKVTVAGQARVADATAYVTAVRSADESMYLAVQVALRALVAGTTVEELLAGRTTLGEQLLGLVRGLDQLGLAIERLELKDIILPAELKRAQGEVLLARAQGAAALERTRGETAALRNLGNAARMAADNPAILHLRLLQQLESTSGHTVIIGAPPIGLVPPPSVASDPKPAPTES